MYVSPVSGRRSQEFTVQINYDLRSRKLISVVLSSNSVLICKTTVRNQYRKVKLSRVCALRDPETCRLRSTVRKRVGLNHSMEGLTVVRLLEKPFDGLIQGLEMLAIFEFLSFKNSWVVIQ